MTIIKNSIFAKGTTLVAGLAMVLSMGAYTPAQAQTNTSLQAQINALLAQIAVLQAQIGGNTTAPSIQFTRDLTIGSTGADVTSLQNWLIAGGYSIPAGATGYFGTQTQGALARYQAANGISPAAGYFGPITRARVNATAVVPPPTTTPPSTTPVLSGGEARLSNYQLVREDADGSEGEMEVEVATARFDVRDGDVRVERMDVSVRATGSGSDQPWRYIDRVSVWANGREIGDMEADARADWNRNGSEYTISLTDLNHIVRRGSTAELTIAFDIAGTIRTTDINQRFDVRVTRNGIRAVDAAGIQQYIGADGATVSFAFTEEASGDLRIRTSRDNPNATTLRSETNRESSRYTVFAWEIQNLDRVDSLVTDASVGVNLNTGTTTDVIRNAWLVLDGDEYRGVITNGRLVFENLDFEIDADETIDAELVVTLVRNAPNRTITFGNIELVAESAQTGSVATVTGSATSREHRIASTGAAVVKVSDSNASSNEGRTVDFQLVFDVTAIGDDITINRTNIGTSTQDIHYNVVSPNGTTTSSAVLQSNAQLDGNTYTVFEGETARFTLTVTVTTNATGPKYVQLLGVDQTVVSPAIETAPRTVNQ